MSKNDLHVNEYIKSLRPGAKLKHARLFLRAASLITQGDNARMVLEHYLKHPVLDLHMYYDFLLDGLHKIGNLDGAFRLARCILQRIPTRYGFSNFVNLNYRASPEEAKAACVLIRALFRKLYTQMTAEEDQLALVTFVEQVSSRADGENRLCQADTGHYEYFCKYRKPVREILQGETIDAVHEQFDEPFPDLALSTLVEYHAQFFRDWDYGWFARSDKPRLC